MANTTYTDVQNAFHSMPQVKTVFNADLERQWFLNALGDYELEIGLLNYDETTEAFPKDITRGVVSTLAKMIYVQYLGRELDRLIKLNGIQGKDISITGVDGSKRVAKAHLDDQIKLIERQLNKQKTTAYT